MHVIGGHALAPDLRPLTPGVWVRVGTGECGVGVGFGVGVAVVGRWVVLPEEARVRETDNLVRIYGQGLGVRVGIGVGV